MEPLSAFEIIGPPMVGPSSSHTAGACRIGWAARQLLCEPVRRADIFLHGSFWSTGLGHGTHEAIAAGLLGLSPDDTKLKDALALAQASGVALAFNEIDLGPQAHPNSVQLHLAGETVSLSVTASSVGGGSIRIQELEGLPFELAGTLVTLIIWHRDTAGFLARITAVLACVEINVAGIRTSRRQRGEEAITAIEIDGEFPQETLDLFRRIPAISRLAILPVLPGYRG